MSAPETFDLEITLPIRGKGTLQEEDYVEIESWIIFPEVMPQTIRLPWSVAQKLRAEWLAAKKERDAEIESDRRAIDAETRAHFRSTAHQ